MDQHALTGWHLRSFARHNRVAMYDKESDAFDAVSPGDAAVEVDAHSATVESGFAAIEARGSQASRDLVKRTRHLPPGLYSIATDVGVTTMTPAAVRGGGTFNGMHLLIPAGEIPAMPAAHRHSMARYAALTNQRGPTVESAIRAFNADFELASQLAVQALAPRPFAVSIGAEIDDIRGRMIDSSVSMADRLIAMDWWVLRAEAGSAFVLGDSPAIASIGLGYDDRWRAIFDTSSMLLAMPLSPDVALLIAPRSVMPLSASAVADGTKALNRQIWRWAHRYVFARSQQDLEEACPGSALDDRCYRVDARQPADRIAMIARGEVGKLFALVLWKRRVGCRLVFGFYPYAAEDRGLFAPPGAHNASTPSPATRQGAAGRAR